MRLLYQLDWGGSMGVKRVLDIVSSLTAIIILIPIFLITAILIYFKLGYPVVFVQERPGKNERIFKIMKFRTMLELRDTNGSWLPDSERITRFGRFLRSTSIDELPQLFNVLKGDMSLVGPRPLLIEYLDIYNERQKKRHDVLPGITGWAQVSGRNLISWKDKLQFDVWYVENWSLGLDMKILYMTILKVLKREGVNQQGIVTVEKFNGAN
jgi:lipopolysaccharide/colanic/teichoic acid biosynthesis glycosyltransferase